jgi:hypothetical protein
MDWITKDGRKFPVHNKNNFGLTKKDAERHLPIYMARSLNGSKDWTMLVKGGGHHSNPYGEQPMIGIKRDEALKMKNNYKFHSVPHGYEGKIPESVYHLSGEGKAFVRPSSLDANDKSNLNRFVKENPNWTSIDDLPNDMFESLVKSAGDDIDKRVKIQTDALRYMRQQKILHNKGSVVTKEPDQPKKDYTIVKTLHQQLNQTRINGFPFFAYTGIKPTIISQTDMNLKPPTNPNKVSSINVHYNKGTDEYDVRIQSGKKIEEINGLQWDNLGNVIVDKMGVR